LKTLFKERKRGQVGPAGEKWLNSTAASGLFALFAYWNIVVPLWPTTFWSPGVTFDNSAHTKYTTPDTSFDKGFMVGKTPQSLLHAV
jgi:hypothetical protein